MKKFRLTPMQEAMLFEGAASASRYVSAIRYQLPENTDAQNLQLRMNELTTRHEMLRTSFYQDEEGLLWQIVADRAEIPLLVTAYFSPEQMEISPFDPHLFRLVLCQNELIVLFHHALLDGWSIGILMAELTADTVPVKKASPFGYYTKWLKQRDEATDLHWWKTYLEEECSFSTLPNRQNSTEYQREELSFTLENSDLLRQCAASLQLTAGRFLQAVWCLLTARLNGGSSVVGCVVSGRSAPVPGITGMVGMCINTLPLVTKLPGSPKGVSFADWVTQWCRQTGEAERHGFCRLSDLIKGSLPHLLTINPSPSGAQYRFLSGTAELVTDFDTTITLDEEILVEFAYNDFIYSDATAKNLKEYFLNVLKAVSENPDIPLEKISFLTRQETETLTAFHENKEILEQIKQKTILDLWQDCVRLYGKYPALIYQDTQYNYIQLEELANRLSTALKANGITAGTCVAIHLNRSERYVISELAILKAGGFFVPLDREWPAERIETIVAETEPALVLDEGLYDQLLAGNFALVSKTIPAPEQPAYMIMTSGTTGLPKGVVATHRNLAAFCLWAREYYGWKAGDSCAMVLGFGFDGSLWDIWLPLLSGGTLHILNDTVRFSMSALGDYCRIRKITHIDLPVTMAESFREIYQNEDALPHLRVMIVGGEEVRKVVPAPYPLSNEYGPTECTICCSRGFIDADSPISIGTPPPNMHAYILDDWGRLCPDGVTGEAYFSGVQVARGYYRSPDLTAQRFLDNPYWGNNENHRIIYRTGDLMKWQQTEAGRQLFFMGRADRQVKINGYRIELGELEYVLQTHPGVAAVVAAIRENPSQEKMLCAYVVPKTDLDPAELYRCLKTKLPSFMHPIILPVKEIPLTASGKVDYHRLPLPAQEEAGQLIPPVTEAEKVLLPVVSKVLKVTGIGTLHNYLELGGNSIRAMEIAFRLEKAGYAITAKDIITSESLAKLAEKITKITPSESAVSETAVAFRPLHAQQGMLFLAQTRGIASYTVTLRVQAEGITPTVLKGRIDRAAELHDILRVGFEPDTEGNAPGEMIGRVYPRHRIPLYTDTPSRKEGIDPLKDPLLDLTLLDNQLTLRYHHIGLDGLSVGLLLRELLNGEFPTSPPSFAAFANRLWADGNRLAADEAWWNSHCQDTRTVPLLPPETAGNAVLSKIEFCSPQLLEQCVAAAKQAHITPAAFLLTAWSTLVKALDSEKGDILIPFVGSCRDNNELMGMCAATYPLRFSGNGKKFDRLARQVQSVMLESTSHLFVPSKIITRLPHYLFVYDDSTDNGNAQGDQDYDLVVQFNGKGGCFLYNQNYIPAAWIDRLAKRLTAVLTQALVNQVSIFFSGEYQLVTEVFSQGRKLPPEHRTVAEIFTDAAAKYAGQKALELHQSCWTYGKLYELAKELAAALGKRGIGPGDVVAFCLPRNQEGILAPLGILLSGAAFLPLDPSWPDERKSEIIRDAGARAVIGNHLAIEMTDYHGRVPADSVYLIYTSGTTGKPKGVILPHSALANQITWALTEFGFHHTDKMLHYIAFTFDPSVWTIFTTLAAGATLSLVSEDLRLDPDSVAAYIGEQEVTLCTFPASVGAEVLQRITDSCLRMAFLGGEAPKNLPLRKGGLEVINSYGPTEACINTTFRRMAAEEQETCNIGVPAANTICYVLDPYNRPCPVGVPGELWIGGVQLAHGYLNREKETQRAFVLHPLFGRLYRTGDLVAWQENGTLEFLGRLDRQVKVRGYRVELGEIETLLCEMPEIIDSKVILREDLLHAYIIWQNKEIRLSAEEISKGLAKRLPAYLIPASFTSLSAFPLTENGKLDYASFPLPDYTEANETEALTETEAVIADIWKTVLSLTPDFVIQPKDNFFRLGGHSLLLFRVTGLLTAAGIPLDIRKLITYPVLKYLAKEAKRINTPESPAKITLSLKGSTEYQQYLAEMENLDLSNRRSFQNILITGGTGFLGSHLIYEFFRETNADICLPCRGDENRIRDALLYYFGKEGGKIADSKRLHPYAFDISKEVPYCDTPLDAIFHTAADVRHYAPEEESHEANVTATRHMLEMAAAQPGTLFVHVSTTGAANVPLICENEEALGPPFHNNYQRTKQIGEQLVRDSIKKGAPISIFRVGNIAPNLETGHAAKSWEGNSLLRMTRNMFHTGLIPETDDAVGYAFVNETARAIRLLSGPVNLTGKTFHIDNPQKVRFSELFSLAGREGTVLSANELSDELGRLTHSADSQISRSASEYLGWLSQRIREGKDTDIIAGRLRMDASLLLLKRLGFQWSPVTTKYITFLLKEENL